LYICNYKLLIKTKLMDKRTLLTRLDKEHKDALDELLEEYPVAKEKLEDILGSHYYFVDLTYDNCVFIRTFFELDYIDDIPTLFI